MGEGGKEGEREGGRERGSREKRVQILTGLPLGLGTLPWGAMSGQTLPAASGKTTP